MAGTDLNLIGIECSGSSRLMGKGDKGVLLLLLKMLT